MRRLSLSQPLSHHGSSNRGAAPAPSVHSSYSEATITSLSQEHASQPPPSVISSHHSSRHSDRHSSKYSSKHSSKHSSHRSSKHSSRNGSPTPSSRLSLSAMSMPEPQLALPDASQPTTTPWPPTHTPAGDPVFPTVPYASSTDKFWQEYGRVERGTPFGTHPPMGNKPLGGAAGGSAVTVSYAPWPIRYTDKPTTDKTKTQVSGWESSSVPPGMMSGDQLRRNPDPLSGGRGAGPGGAGRGQTQIPLTGSGYTATAHPYGGQLQHNPPPLASGRGGPPGPGRGRGTLAGSGYTATAHPSAGMLQRNPPPLAGGRGLGQQPQAPGYATTVNPTAGMLQRNPPPLASGRGQPPAPGRGRGMPAGMLQRNPAPLGPGPGRGPPQMPPGGMPGAGPAQAAAAADPNGGLRGGFNGLSLDDLPGSYAPSLDADDSTLLGSEEDYDDSSVAFSEDYYDDGSLGQMPGN